MRRALLLLVVLRGEDRGTDTALLIRPSASGSRIQKLGLPRPASLFSYVYGSGTGSPLAWRHPAGFSCFACQMKSCLVPARRISKAYGIAKLLPLIVPVKRETQQVVSSTMTGLVRGWRI